VSDRRWTRHLLEEIPGFLGYMPDLSVITVDVDQDWNMVTMHEVREPVHLTQWQTRHRSEGTGSVMVAYCKDPGALSAVSNIAFQAMCVGVARSEDWAEIVTIRQEGFNGLYSCGWTNMHFHPYEPKQEVGFTISPDRDAWMSRFAYDASFTRDADPVAALGIQRDDTALADAMRDPRGLDPTAALAITRALTTKDKVDDFVADVQLHTWLADNVIDLVRSSSSTYVLHAAAALLTIGYRQNALGNIYQRLDAAYPWPADLSDRIEGLREQSRNPKETLRLHELYHSLGLIRALERATTKS